MRYQNFISIIFDPNELRNDSKYQKDDFQTFFNVEQFCNVTFFAILTGNKILATS